MFSLDTLYYGHASESYSTEYFEFNVLPSLTSAFGTTSDIVIVFMTLNRFELVQVRKDIRKYHQFIIFHFMAQMTYSYQTLISFIKH